MIGLPTKENIDIFKREALIILLILSLGWNVYLTIHAFEESNKRDLEKQKMIYDMQEALKVYREATIRGAEIEKASRILNPQNVSK